MQRTYSWPPAVRVTTTATDIGGASAPKPRSGSMSATTPSKSTYDQFEDDLEDHPEEYFLTPTYEYEDWAEDDEAGEEIEWNAGITDFALFDNDRRRAQETHEQLPSRWDGFMTGQASALQRAAQRTRTQSTSELKAAPLFAEDIPELTPDNSPRLGNDLDVESFNGQRATRSSVPSHLIVVVTPPEEDDDGNAVGDDEDEDSPLSFYVERATKRIEAQRKVQRPGLRYSRTMSGKVHTWRRPSWRIYPVGEDTEAEERAELGAESEDKCRGRQA